MALHLLKGLLKGIITEKAAVPGLDRNVLHAMTVSWPPAKLQHSFVEIVTDYQSQVGVLEITRNSPRRATSSFPAS